jgi:hypothetical protein
MIIGMLSIRAGFKKESMKSSMLKVNYTPPRNYGKFFFIAFGLLCIIGGIMLLFVKPK